MSCEISEVDLYETAIEMNLPLDECGHTGVLVLYSSETQYKCDGGLNRRDI